MYPQTAEQHGLTFVGPEGPRTARIALIGEAPGADEERSGKPFVGAAGRFLTHALNQVGLKREELWVTNVVKVRPLGNKLDRLRQYGTKPDDWVESLLEELRGLPSLKVVIPLGELALKAVTKLTGISGYRGSYIQEGNVRPGVLTLPTLHPSYILQYGYHLHTAFMHDLSRAKKAAERGHTPRARREVVEPGMEEVRKAVERVRQEGKLCWDLETFGDQISCFGFTSSGDWGICVPFKKGLQNYWSYPDELEIWGMLGELLYHPGILKIAHNGFRFDNEYMLRLFGRQPAGPHFDTLLAHAVAWPDLPHSLAFLNSLYSDIPYYKDDTKQDDGGGKFRLTTDLNYYQRLWKYNCKDVMATFDCYEGLVRELEDFGLWKVFGGYIQPLYRCLFNLQSVGIPVNEGRFKEQQEEQAKLVEKLQGELAGLVGRPFNALSGKQVKEYLYEECGLPHQWVTSKTTGKNILDTSEEALEKVLYKVKFGKYPKKVLARAGKVVQVVERCLELRSANKLLGTYFTDKIKRPEDGRVRTSYGTTETGRLSSKGVVWGYGMNLQNVPAVVQPIFECPPGRVLIYKDLGQAEARVVALVSGCQAMLDEFAQPGGDIFKRVASNVFQKPQDQITKDERQLCKRVVHGSNYKMGKKTFSEQTGLSWAEGEKVQGAYYQAFPEILGWHEWVRQELLRCRTLWTCFGRRRTFLGRLPYNEGVGHDTWKEAIAYNPQSTVGDALNQGLLKLYWWFEGGEVRDARVWLQVHDSLIVECWEEDVESVVGKMVEVFQRTVCWEERSLVIPSETRVGRVWGRLEEFTAA